MVILNQLLNILANLRLSEVYIQKPSLQKYAEIYGDFTIIDGTHNMSQYNLILMMFSNIDCLGN